MFLVTLQDRVDTMFFQDFNDFRVKWNSLVKPRRFLVFKDLICLDWAYDPLVSTYNYKLVTMVMRGYGCMSDLSIYVLPEVIPDVSETMCKIFETAVFVSLINGDVDFVQFGEAFNNLCASLQNCDGIRFNAYTAFLYSYKSGREGTIIWKG
jgi:hypothetical protein